MKKSKAKVILEGDVYMMDFPFIINNNWSIPKGWYLIDNYLSNDIICVYKDDNFIKITENFYINNKSAIKTDKELKEGDIIEW